MLGIKFRALYMLTTHLTLMYTLRSMGFKLLFEPLGYRGKSVLEATHLYFKQKAFVYFYIQSSVRIQSLSVKGLGSVSLDILTYPYS